MHETMRLDRRPDSSARASARQPRCVRARTLRCCYGLDAAAVQAAFLQLRVTLPATRALIGDAALLRSHCGQLQGRRP
jgi:hypothetical protein